MTLILSGDITLRRTWQPMDPDAAAYITAVESADGQALEEKVKIAIDNFVLGCKADGFWDAIKASCILAGARTLNGALVPLAGVAPTNFNFVSGDYNRKTGLKGSTSNKYLDPSRLNNADPQDSRHISVFTTEADSNVTAFFMGTDSLGTSGSSGFYSLSSSIFYGLSSTGGSSLSNTVRTGLIAVTRSDGSSFTVRQNQTNSVQSKPSASPTSSPYLVFSRTGQAPSITIDARLAFYSIGESLDLALLDARVTDLINKFAEVIP